MTTAATLDPPVLVLPPGGEATCHLTVRNHTDIVEGYQLEVLGDIAGWVTVDPPTLRLYPAAEATVRLVVRMPRLARVNVQEIPFAVRVTPMEHPEDVVVPEGILQIGPIVGIGADLLPETSRARRTATHDVAIDNTGNVPLPVELQATDPEGILRFRARPQAFTVPPGEASVAQLRIRHRGLRWRGSPAPKKFKLTVASPDAAPLTLDGTAIQQPVVGTWLWKAAAVLAALALLGTGLWFGLIKPTVRSAADKAAQDAVATEVSQAAVEGRLPGAGGGGKTGSGGASPSAGGADASASASADAAGSSSSYYQTVSVQANQGKTVSKTVTRPKDTKLEISYIQLQAPQGDTALLKIIVGDQTLFPYQLYNIRIYDWHPLPPIAVPADKALKLELTCTRAGTDPQGVAQTACAVDVLFTGTTAKAS